MKRNERRGFMESFVVQGMPSMLQITWENGSFIIPLVAIEVTRLTHPNLNEVLSFSPIVAPLPFSSALRWVEVTLSHLPRRGCVTSVLGRLPAEVGSWFGFLAP